jgi:pimeloyl-ACP methyl ester carboxylesterase
MPLARANGIELAYEALGRDDDPTLLLIMGFGSQLIAWPDRLCQLLVERGFRVVRFDNRDVGLSTKVSTGYTLADMADDAAGLLDALAIPHAHVVGASMGGFIAQLLALAHPQRVLSLCSMMSSTGDRAVGQPQPELLPVFVTPMPLEHDGYLAARLAILRRIASPGYPFDEARARDLLERSFARGYFPAGTQRQLLAVLASPDRTAALSRLKPPTLVIHGADDPVAHVSGGEATARAIPGARLWVVPGMGHDLPEALWGAFTDAIVDNARRATA